MYLKCFKPVRSVRTSKNQYEPVRTSNAYSNALYNVYIITIIFNMRVMEIKIKFYQLKNILTRSDNN